MERRPRQSTADRIHAVAMTRHGVVRTQDLLAAGLDGETIRRQVGYNLRPIGRRGWYLVPGGTDVWTTAALGLARSSGLALAYRAAAAVYGWDGFDRPDARLLAEPPLICPWTSRSDLRPYRHHGLSINDLRTVGGLRVPRPAWLLASLGTDRYVGEDRLEQAVECALRTRATTEGALWAEVGARRRATMRTIGQPAAHPPSMLESVLHRRGRGSPPTGSLLETLTVQRVLRPFGIEVIARQVEIFAHGQFVGRPDFLLAGWTVLEVDGGQHLTDEHRRADRTRDLRLGSAGLMVTRVGPEDVADPALLAGRLSALLAGRLSAVIERRQAAVIERGQAAASSPVANAAHSSA